MKRFLSLLLVAVMLLSAAGCNSRASSDKGSTPTPVGESSGQSDTDETPISKGQINFDEEPYTITVCYPVMGVASPDQELIQEKINEIAIKEINAYVQLEAIDLFSMSNTYALKASSQEKMDLIMLMPGGNYLTTFVNTNMIVPIDDLLDEWGPVIKETAGDWLPVGQFLGKQYTVPQNSTTRTMGYGFNVSVPLCEKYNIDIESIRSLEDLEAVFEIIHKNEPDITVLAPESTGGSIIGPVLGLYDTLGSRTSRMVIQEDGSLKVVLDMESPEYMEAAKRVRDWYQKGYISKDVITTQEAGSTLLEAGTCFATAIASVGASGGTIGAGVEGRHVVFESGLPLLRTADSQLFMWAVPTTCTRPEKSIQLLNLFNSSAELANLFFHGIEGMHYEINDKGAVVPFENAGWVNYWPLVGDAFKLLASKGDVKDGTVEEFRQKEAEFNKLTKISPAYGFTLDTTDIKTEIAACNAVGDEFGAAIGNGAVDPEVEIPRYVQKLYDAGVQRIIDEQQRQLEAWVALQN